MKLARLTRHADAPLGPPPALHAQVAACLDELHLRRSRLHVIEARRDLGELDPILDGILASVEEALTVTIEGISRSWL